MAFLFLYFCFSTITPLKHTHTHMRTRGIGPAALVRSSPWLRCALMYLRILFCCSIVRAEIEAHRWERKVTEHGGTKSPIFCSLSACASVRSRSIYLSSLACPSPARTRTHALATTQRIPAAVAAARSYSFTLQAVSRQLLECPDLKCTEIATIVSLTTKYQASESGLSDSQLLFIRVWGVERPDHIEDWNHRGYDVFKEDGMGWDGGKKKKFQHRNTFFFSSGGSMLNSSLTRTRARGSDMEVRLKRWKRWLKKTKCESEW